MPGKGQRGLIWGIHPYAACNTTAQNGSTSLEHPGGRKYDDRKAHLVSDQRALEAIWTESRILAWPRASGRERDGRLWKVNRVTYCGREGDGFDYGGALASPPPPE